MKNSKAGDCLKTEIVRIYLEIYHAQSATEEEVANIGLAMVRQNFNCASVLLDDKECHYHDSNIAMLPNRCRSILWFCIEVPTVAAL